MDRAGHYQRAEKLANQAADHIREGEDAKAASLIALAQVHATLAASADSAIFAAVVAVAATAKASGNSTAPKRPDPNAPARLSTSIAVRGAREIRPASSPRDEQP